MSKKDKKSNYKPKTSVIYKIQGNGPTKPGLPLKVTATFTLIPNQLDQPQTVSHMNEVACDIEDKLNDLFEDQDYEISDSGGTIKIEIIKSNA
jgi:hypothetical protein